MLEYLSEIMEDSMISVGKQLRPTMLCAEWRNARWSGMIHISWIRSEGQVHRGGRSKFRGIGTKNHETGGGGGGGVL